MKKILLGILVLTTAISFAVEKKILVKKNSQIEGIDNLQEETSFSNREQIIIQEIDFEGDVSGWNMDSGWGLSTANYHSPTHSINSPDQNNTGEYGVNDIFSEPITLPMLGEGETMQYKFWVYNDMPDHAQDDDPSTNDVDESQYIADSYSLSLMDPTTFSWHSTDFNPNSVADGANWWCADPEAAGGSGGYLNSWVQYLDTPTFTVPANSQVSADMYWYIESPAGVPAGEVYDGWDQANIQISTDEGESYTVITCSDPYDFDCGYGAYYNNLGCQPGWAGTSEVDWHNVSCDLSSYAGEQAIVRFGFFSDPCYATEDDCTDAIYSDTGFQIDNITVSDGLGNTVYYNDGTDDGTMAVSGEVWVDQLYDYGEASQPGAMEWNEYLPGYPWNTGANVFLDISEYAGQTIVFRFQTRSDGDHTAEGNSTSGQGTGLWIDDFTIFKQSSGSYPSPQNLTADSGDSQVSLSWDDMNSSGIMDYIYDNDAANDGITLTEGSTGMGWAGVEMNIAGNSTVNSITVFNVNNAGTQVTLAAFTPFGTLYNVEPTNTLEVSLEDGWNTFDVNWQFTHNFILAQSFDAVNAVALDGTAAPSSHSMVLLSGGWSHWNDEVAMSGGALNDGEWGIRANVTKEGANVTYNVYRDGMGLANGLPLNNYTDNTAVNNSYYDYTVSATYENGEESGFSNTAMGSPLSETVHELSWDDGTAEESSFDPGSDDRFGVKFSANGAGEDAVRFKWFQDGVGGAFYLRIREDNNGMPGEQIYQKVISGGLVDGWNERDLITDEWVFSGDFWLCIDALTSTNPIGIDTNSNSGNSYTSLDAWVTADAVEGNLLMRILLDGDCIPGDANLDTAINVLDIVTMVNFILGTQTALPSECSADANGDGTINVLDIVTTVNIILG